MILNKVSKKKTKTSKNHPQGRFHERFSQSIDFIKNSDIQRKKKYQKIQKFKNLKKNEIITKKKRTRASLLANQKLEILRKEGTNSAATIGCQ
uniref:Uncharacterized protein n=1 Tax=Rhizophora mucronata TaxID=61149 RepID=A0A2P2JX12_RHIMU